MHFGFALELSDIDLWNIDLLDTNLDLLDTDILSKSFVCLHSVFKTLARYVFKTSSRHVFTSRRLQEVFSVTIFCLPRHLERRKIVTLKTCWRLLQDQQMFTGECLTLHSVLHTDDLLVDLILRVLTFCQGSRWIGLLVKSGPGNLDPDPKKPGPWKTWNKYRIKKYVWV